MALSLRIRRKGIPDTGIVRANTREGNRGGMWEEDGKIGLIGKKSGNGCRRQVSRALEDFESQREIFRVN